jgi:hypothetical protein
MEFLKRLFPKHRPAVQQLPMGSFTVDRHGNVMMTTIASSYPPAVLREIANAVLLLFRGAWAAEMPLSELAIHFASLSITAREQGGGAIIFLSPQTSFANHR